MKYSIGKTARVASILAILAMVVQPAWAGAGRGGSRGGGGSGARGSPHGNSRLSTRPQVLYGIFRTDNRTGRTTIEKLGVSGGRTIAGPRRLYSVRAVSQARARNRDPQANDNARYSSRILGRANDRNTILQMERNAVQRHLQARGARPPRNLRP
jgi:hypothetical protein